MIILMTFVIVIVGGKTGHVGGKTGHVGGTNVAWRSGKETGGGSDVKTVGGGGVRSFGGGNVRCAGHSDGAMPVVLRLTVLRISSSTIFSPTPSSPKHH